MDDLTPSPKFKTASGAPYNVSPAGTHFHPETPLALTRLIDRMIRSGSRVRIFLGDVKTGKSWHDEYDVSGVLSRSMGPCKVPILVAPGARGGAALLDHCIIGMIQGAGNWIWRHPKLDLGSWSVKETCVEIEGKTYRAETHCDGKLYGRHRSLLSAQRLTRFMTGERMAA